MPMFEINLMATKSVYIHGATWDEAATKAISANETLGGVELDGWACLKDTNWYDELPDHIRTVVDQAEAGDDLEVLGQGQTGNRVYDDGEWRVWIERVGPEDGYYGPPVTVEHYDGDRWSDFSDNSPQ